MRLFVTVFTVFNVGYPYDRTEMYWTTGTQHKVWMGEKQ